VLKKVKKKDKKTKRFIARGGRNGALKDFIEVLKKAVTNSV
jgi:hypothetical protein